jgi:hypothetical protein
MTDHTVTLWNWPDDMDVTPENADCLEKLDIIRIEQPIIHILIMGTRTVVNMAVRIGWPTQHILWQLREYKKQGLVFDREGIKSVEWYFTMNPAARDFLEMKDWVTLNRRPGGLFSSQSSNGE